MKVLPPRVSLAGGQSDRSGRWPSRVWMTSMPLLAGRVQHPLRGLDGGEQQRGVVAELLAEPAGQDEVALHVDDDERRGGRVELDRERLGFELRS